MVSLTQIPITLTADKAPTKQIIRDLIGTFLCVEWPLVDLETLQISFHADFTNTHCIVERLNPDACSAVEPRKVFIKLFKDSETGIDAFKHLILPKDQEATICHEYSLTGRGPKVYGLFQTEDGVIGRIDEFLDARNLEPGDVEDAAIRAEIARSMANLHALDTSLQGYPVAAYYEAVIPGLQKYHKMEKLKTLGREGGVPVDGLVDYDFAWRLKLVIDSVEAIAGKAALCIHDVQFMNTMVRDHPQPGESRVALIDFEMVMRNYRGFDIGGHFLQKMFKWFDEESKIAGCRKYSDDEKRDFCDHYAKEWNRLTGDADTTEQVFLESEYGYLMAITFDIHNMLWFMNEHDGRDPLDLEGLNKLVDEFVDQYRKLGLREPEDKRD